MRQFVTFNIWTSDIMTPNAFVKEQVFAMCEKLSFVCVANEIFLRLREKYGMWNAKDYEAKDLNEVANTIAKEVLLEIHEPKTTDENTTFIASRAIGMIKLSDSCHEALKKIYSRRFNWKSRDIQKLLEYYRPIVDNMNILKNVLPQDLNYWIIKQGLKVVIHDMEELEKIFSMASGKGNDEFGRNKAPDYYRILLYPEGLVSGQYYCSMKDGDYPPNIFWRMAGLCAKKYNNPEEEIYSYTELANELYAESQFENGTYYFENDVLNCKVEEEDDDKDSDETSNKIVITEKRATPSEEFFNFYQFIQFNEGASDQDVNIENPEYRGENLRSSISLSKDVRKILDKYRAQLYSVRSSMEQWLSIDFKRYIHIDRKDAFCMLMLFKRYTSFGEKDIFHILSIPSLENSVLGLVGNHTRHGEMMFFLKSDLLLFLKHFVPDSSYTHLVEEIIPQTYMSYEKQISHVRWFFTTEGLTKDTYQQADHTLMHLLLEKRLEIHREQMCISPIIDELFSQTDEKEDSKNRMPEMKLSEKIHLKIYEFEYIGIIHDMTLVYRNMRKWLISLPRASIRLLLDKQMKLEEIKESTDQFDFEKYMRKWSKDIAEVLDPGNVEKRSKDIKRYAGRCFCLWTAILQWYPFSDWAKSYNNYADFETMVALVQVEGQLRQKSKIKLPYLYAYKGDAGEEMTVRFRDDLPNDRIAVEVLMQILFWQILSNRGFDKSVRVALRIMIAYGKRYKRLLQADNPERLAEVIEWEAGLDAGPLDYNITATWESLRREIQKSYTSEKN